MMKGKPMKTHYDAETQVLTMCVALTQRDAHTLAQQMMSDLKRCGFTIVPPADPTRLVIKGGKTYESRGGEVIMVLDPCAGIEGKAWTAKLPDGTVIRVAANGRMNDVGADSAFDLMVRCDP